MATYTLVPSTLGDDDDDDDGDGDGDDGDEDDGDDGARARVVARDGAGGARGANERVRRREDDDEEDEEDEDARDDDALGDVAVSYTHLTLPTILLV